MTGYPFPVEFTPKTSQVFHGPKNRMYNCTKEFTNIGHSRLSETEFLDYMVRRSAMGYKEIRLTASSVSNCSIVQSPPPFVY